MRRNSFYFAAWPISFILLCVESFTRYYVTAKTVISYNYVKVGEVLTSFYIVISENIATKNYAISRVSYQGFGVFFHF